MKVNSRTYEDYELGNVKRVDIHKFKQWARANLPVTSQLRGILFLEENVLGAEELSGDGSLAETVRTGQAQPPNAHAVDIDS